MPERIVAYGGQNSYARSEGRFTVSSSEPRESQPPKRGRPEGGQRHEIAQRPNLKSTRELLHDPSTFLGKINGLLAGVMVDKQPVEIPFGEAWSFSRTINSLRDTNRDKKVRVFDAEISNMKGLLGKVGIDAKAIDAMQDREVIAAMQLALPRVKIAEPEVSDFKYEKEKDREAAKIVAREEVKKARDEDGSEEILTPKEIGERVVVEQLRTIAGGADVEDDGHGEPIEARSFKSLLQEKLDNLGKPVDMRPIDLEIQRRLRSNNPAYIHTAVRDLEALRATREHDPKLLEEINEVFDPVLQMEFLNVKDDLDRKYTFLLESLRTSGKIANLSDLDDESKNALISLRYGTSRYSGEQKGFDMITQHLLSVAASEKEPPGLEGLRAWYALKKVEDVRTAYEIQQMTEIQPDPQENIKSIYAAMTFAQKSRSSEGFGTAQQRIEPLLQAVELSTDSSVTSEMKTRLREQFEAFLKITPNFILMYQSDGDAEQELRAATNIENESLFYFYDRFSDLKDKDGKLYLLDKDGNRLKDSQGNPLNPLSEMEGADVYQYFLDRYKVNQVQKMTRRDLNINSGNPDEQWIIKRILIDKDIVPGLQQNQPLPHLGIGQIRKLQAAWSDDGTRTNASWEWYKRQTYIGVDGYYSEGSSDVTDIDVKVVANKKYFGKKLRDVREDVIAQTIFRKRLESFGIAPERIDALFKDYDTLQALKALGANLARYKYSSAMDRFRIYKKNGDVVASIFGEETPYNEREVDHMPDYFLQEGHGDKRMNQLVLKKIDVKHRSFNLASNMRMYRLLSLEGVMTDAQRKEFDKEVEAELKEKKDLVRPQVEAYVLMSMVYEGFNPKDPSKQKLDIFNINWAEASKLAKHYTFDDNSRDRVNAVKFYRDAHKEFVFRPTAENLSILFDAYYSTRAVRKEEGAEDYLELYREAGPFWKEWFDLEHDMTDVDFENAVDRAKNTNVISRQKAEKILAKELGVPFQRYAKQWADFLRVSALEFGRPGYLASSFWDWLKTLMAYLSQSFPSR